MTSTTGQRSDRFHCPVLAEEVAGLLLTRPDGTYVDLTCGGGGHLRVLAERLGAAAVLIGVDRDPEALEAARENLKSIPQTLKLVERSFAELGDIMRECGLKSITGALLDLGVSSFQLNTDRRGFSYQHDGPLDMRMGRGGRITAEEIINGYDEKELAVLFRRYGEERRSSRAAAAIVSARARRRLVTTGQLRQVLEPIFPKREMNASLARIFQALRIEVNDELGQLAAVLPQAHEALEPGGRLVVIAYHSLEDRPVKNYIREKARGCTCPPKLPQCICGKKPSLRMLTRKAVRPSPEEIKNNPRSSSARLRAAEKIG